ncbi:MAG TPA: hypothetical protein PLP23_06290 [Panacibacter sp.]|nr:hypothetical protein [Panacibacter sp.]
MPANLEQAKNQLDNSGLAKIIVVANTADYLYDCFVRNQSVLEFCQKHTDAELIDIFYGAYNEYRAERNIDNLVIIYACIVSISLKQSAYVFGFFNNLNNYPDIKWANKLNSIFNSRMQIIDISDIDFQIPEYGIYQPLDSNVETNIVNA